MADKAEKKAESAPAGDKDGHGKEAGGGGLLTKLPVLLGGVMIIEAVVLFAGFKFLGGGAPKAAQGAELTATDAGGKAESTDKKEEGKGGAKEGEKKAEGKEGEKKEGASASAEPADPKGPAEVLVVDFRAPNKQNGRTFLYDVAIYAVTKNKDADKVKSVIKSRENLISDRVRTIIAQSDPEKLGGGSEPGLETLRRQVKFQLEEIVGEGIIDEVLVPRCIPFRTDF